MPLLANLFFFRKRLFGVCLEIPHQVGGPGLLAFPVPLMGHDHGHDLAGSGPDAGQTDIPVDAHQEKEICVADAADNLHGVMNALLAGFGDEFLGNELTWVTFVYII